MVSVRCASRTATGASTHTHSIDYDYDAARGQLLYSPPDFCNSGATRLLRSGSSPYQKIHSSLAAVNDSGGCVTAPLPPDTDMFRSNRLAEASGSCLGAATRRHTHRMSAARQRAYELRTGSSSGSPLASGRSPRPSLRHLMPHRSVCRIGMVGQLVWGILHWIEKSIGGYISASTGGGYNM